MQIYPPIKCTPHLCPVWWRCVPPRGTSIWILWYQVTFSFLALLFLCNVMSILQDFAYRHWCPYKCNHVDQRHNLSYFVHGFIHMFDIVYEGIKYLMACGYSHWYLRRQWPLGDLLFINGTLWATWFFLWALISSCRLLLHNKWLGKIILKYPISYIPLYRSSFVLDMFKGPKLIKKFEVCALIQAYYNMQYVCVWWSQLYANYAIGKDVQAMKAVVGEEA